ncbi:MAG: deoxyribose-phosphate aldolase [Gammaproteobacteria bacterium CG11_big_fil_rev_8_21_14_0_20_46_22]|nr:MAG: deoxyribose-phosphate aldolase [Gammaproteobacteria bacterium CG12_big_fil_rev_8_21_14_0_65_46_12]PIR11031.1 MAG: deoxyribose-phosphate aldolase [Gammaproteobacteria bacterium CG11_big_fil_rev_8_21_14_0_20_46_22]
MSFNLSQLWSFLDLTNLDEQASKEDIEALCKMAKSPLGEVAAVCLYPNYIALAKTFSLKVATVCNFASGNEALSDVLTDIDSAIEQGADEIDVVMPYQSWLSGNEAAVRKFLTECKQRCKAHCLKVILESGAFTDETSLYNASRLAIDCGADFIKTSTGKVAQGASLEAAKIMLSAINDANSDCGFKASGGIGTIKQATAYAELTENILHRAISAKNFRLGASRLADALLSEHLSQSAS